jgi:hypothetical protein
VLAGNYPNPSFAVDMATQAELNAHEADTTAVHGVANTADIVLRTLVDAKGDLLLGTAADTLARLGVGADGQILTADAAQAAGVKWAAPASVSSLPASVTSLPISPTDGQVIRFLVDATNGIEWLFVYRQGSGSAYKWEFLGGPPLISEVNVSEDRGAGNTYANLTTVGPSVVLPLAGDYEVHGGFVGRVTVAGTAWMSYSIGATAAVDADGWNVGSAAAGNSHNAAGQRRYIKTFASAATLTAKYRNSGGSGSAIFQQRFMAVRPVRV